MTLVLQTADLNAPDFIALINTHAALMLELSPPGSCHFLPIDGLKTPDVTVWDIREDAELLCCGALKHHDGAFGEIKSMHTAAAARGRGLGRMMLEHILAEAVSRGYTRLSLETGTSPGFEPARKLYETYGFTTCGPFAEYTLDPHSYFMTKAL